MSISVSESFQDQLIAILPGLRIQALSLTRNPTAADDLVQDAVCNAVAAQGSFIIGTNFPAWMHRILRNRFISNLRNRRDTIDIDDLPQAALATAAPHEDRLVLKELDSALGRLPTDQREALVMVVIQGMSYDELAEATGCAIGTAKSRVFRARKQLEIWLMGENKSFRKIRSETKSQGASSQKWHNLAQAQPTISTPSGAASGCRAALNDENRQDSQIGFQLT